MSRSYHTKKENKKQYSKKDYNSYDDEEDFKVFKGARKSERRKNKIDIRNLPEEDM